MQLSVPSRTAPKKGAFDSRPTHVKRWIDNLPMANIGATTRQLFEALNDLNQQDIAAQNRFKALELLRKPIGFVANSMKKHFVGRALPLSDKNLKIARLSRELTHALATGYKVLVMEQIAGVGREDRKLLTTSLHRAMHHLGEVLLKTYQVYEACPTGCWLEIHSLYRYAEKNELHQSPVTDDFSKGRALTIDETYKRILLLALSSPYRLRHGEVESIYDLLKDWAPLCELLPVSGPGKPLFSCNLDTDSPPTYLVLRNANENKHTSRALYTMKLAKKARDTLSELRKSGSGKKSKLNESTLRHLMLAWGIMPKRRFSRNRQHADVLAAIGLNAVHYFVSGEFAFSEASVSEACQTDLAAPASSTSIVHSDTGRQSSDQSQPHLWEAGYSISGSTPVSPVQKAVADAAAGVRIDPSHRTQSWKMVNVSAGGYCLLWDNTDTTRSQVGELLGIREQRDPDTFHWRLGVIRWQKYADKDGLQLGIEMLSPGAVAIAGYPEKTAPKAPTYCRGLLLPEIASLQQQATLLLPSPPFQTQETAVIDCHGKSVRVRLTKMLENTGSFAQFQYEPLAEVSPRSSEAADTQDSKGEFDDVWELL